jgi:hypothetical protein
MRLSAVVTGCVAGIVFSASLQAQQEMPPDYRGLHVRVQGVFITPVSNRPFSADVQIVSRQTLPGGDERVLTTRDHIARSSSGMIHNEMHHLVPMSFQGEPHLRAVHLYDPSSRLSVFYSPDTRLAREAILRQPMATPARALPPAQMRVDPGEVVTQLGEQSFQGLTLQGMRKTRTIAAPDSGTGQPVTVTDEYWYSPDLSLYVMVRHQDPRSGEQIVTVTNIDRAEPSADQFVVPATYKVVDETLPEESALEH